MISQKRTGADSLSPVRPARNDRIFSRIQFQRYRDV